MKYKYCCDSFEECMRNKFIELFGNDYTVQVYEFETDERIEFVLEYCPFCGKKLDEFTE